VNKRIVLIFGLLLIYWIALVILEVKNIVIPQPLVYVGLAVLFLLAILGYTFIFSYSSRDNDDDKDDVGK